MFERFTRGARDVVVAAHTEAGALGHDRIAPEHLLLGVAATPGRAGEVLARHGASADVLRTAAARRAIDPEALAAIGIDLEEIRRHVEASFGAGALDRRRRRVRSTPFTASAKKAMELAVREAVRLGDREIGAEHVVLGLLRGGDVAGLLERVGAPVDEIRAEVSPAASRPGPGA
jgi:ATP-dependent Clp protease ATP-binding subunit ClpA